MGDVRIDFVDRSTNLRDQTHWVALNSQQKNEVFSGLVAHQVLPLNLGRGARPERVWGAVVSGNYFDMLGVKAAVGRTFLPEEDRTPGRGHRPRVMTAPLRQRS